MITFKKILNEELRTAHVVKFYVDLDGTLCDFEKQFLNVFGDNSIKSMEQFKETHTDLELWNVILKDKDKFWSTMEWMPEGKKLWDYLLTLNMPIEILSAIAHDEFNYAKEGKREWVDTNLGMNVKVNLVSKSMKKYYAADNTVLIDDDVINIQEFNNAGGIGILYTNTDEVINKINKLLGLGI